MGGKNMNNQKRTKPVAKIEIFLAEKIKGLRKEKKLTHLQLSERCNLDQSTISQLENNKQTFTIVNLYSICKVLDINMSDMILELEQSLEVKPDVASEELEMLLDLHSANMTLRRESDIRELISQIPVLTEEELSTATTLIKYLALRESSIKELMYSLPLLNKDQLSAVTTLVKLFTCK